MVATVSNLRRDRTKSENQDSTAFPSLGTWRFPRQLSEFYRGLGVTSLFEWQIDCLSIPGVLDENKNLLFAAPTSAGKTLVAEILIWKSVTAMEETKRRKAIYIVPFVSVGREKVVYLQNLFKRIGSKVDAYIGSQNSIAGIHSWDVAVCTIEKANNLINRCIEEETLHLIGTIVIDEFHIIGDPQRGYLVELLVTKVLQMTKLKQISIQIVGMSATISNLSTLARWMDAAEFVTDFRPVALSESLYSEGTFSNRKMETIRNLAVDYRLPGDHDNIVGLCLETVVDSLGVLVFCPTKHWCEKLSETIASTFGKILKEGLAVHLTVKLRKSLDQSTIGNFCGDYQRIVGIVDPGLKRTLPFGVAFHHAGLTMEERDQLERGFRSGAIRVLVATSTLSSGVNLPARRVIIRSPWGQTGAKYGPCLTHSSYKQMIGRAGRKGIDVEGESVIVCKKQEVRRALELMNGSLESVESALINRRQLLVDNQKANVNGGTSIRFKRAVLEAVVGQFGHSTDEIVTYINCTLMAAERTSDGPTGVDHVRRLVQDGVSYLVAQQFIAMDVNQSISATQLGRATLASAMNPEEAWFMFQDLKQAQRALALDNELHMVYLVTPTYMQDQWGSDFEWFNYHRVWCQLSDEQRRVSQLVGVSEAFIILSARKQGARPNDPSSPEARKYAIHMRFYTAMALYELVEETQVSVVAEKFGCSRGFLQALQQQASTYAGMAIAFCDRLGWWYMKTLLTGFAERIAFGVRRELTELVQIDGMDGSRARCFHHSGFTSLANLVYGKSTDIAAALRKAVPFNNDGASNGSLKRCWLAGHPEMTEEQAVTLLQSRAKAILEENLRRFGISLEKCAVETKLVSTTIQAETTAENAQVTITERGEAAAEESAMNEIIMEDDRQKEDAARVVEEMNAMNRSMDNVETMAQMAKSIESIGNQSKSADAMIDRMPVEPTVETLESTDEPYQFIMNDDDSKDVHDPSDAIMIVEPQQQPPQPTYDDLDEIMMNMSRVSLTPRSNEGTPSSASKIGSAPRNPFGELTDSQLCKMINENGFGCSPLFKKSDDKFGGTSPLWKNDDGQFGSSRKTDETGQVPSIFAMNEDQPLEASPLASERIDEKTSTNNNDVGIACSNRLILPTMRPMSQSQPNSSIKKSSSIAIRSRSANDCVMDAGDVDLFDDYPPDDDPMEEDDGARSKEGFDDGPVNDHRQLTLNFFDDDEDHHQNGDDSPESGIDTISNSTSQSIMALDLRTPVSQLVRKRQRPSRTSSEENTTPSPLVRKCSRRTDRLAITVGRGGGTDLRDRLNREAIDGVEKRNNELIVVDTCSSFNTFTSFAAEWRAQKRFAIVVDEGKKTENNDDTPRKKIINGRNASSHDDRKLVGLAICWSIGTVYYLPLDVGTQSSDEPEPPVTNNERLRLIKRCLCAKSADDKEKIVFDFLRAQRSLKTLIVGPLIGSIRCARTADWMLTCGNDDMPLAKSIDGLINRYSTRCKVDAVDNSRPFAEAASDLYLTWTSIETQLRERELWPAFVDVEMPSAKIISEMETNGAGLDLSDCRRVCDRIKELSERLERRAHALAGRTFSLNSPAELSKILFVELKLPPGGVSTTMMAPRSNHSTVRRHYSTSKEVLEKLLPLHPLAGVILDWRKLHWTLSSAVLPLLRGTSYADEGTRRVYGTYDWYSATGRVIMHEPSLQTMPKRFELTTAINVGEEVEIVDIRNLIVAEKGYTLLSADYSQLELRILAHLSEDEKLLEILNSDDGDVFRIIASAWLSLPSGNITNEQRQRAKKLCYGVIYGMGARTLADELEVSEETAVGFMDSFKAQFPGVFRWMEQTVAGTRETGYVKTLTGRTRYLPSIRLTTRSLLDQRLQAERQAINTSVQGSAADVFKSALRDVSGALKKLYSTVDKPCRFVLQLHDELILEVKTNLLDQAADIVRRQMENCVQLRVQLRVRLGAGRTWGEMKNMDV